MFEQFPEEFKIIPDCTIQKATNRTVGEPLEFSVDEGATWHAEGPVQVKAGQRVLIRKPQKKETTE